MEKLEKADDRKISAGSFDLNKWLFGGYEKDIVSVIYGDSGTGKTNFCLLAAISQAKKGNKVIYIDTEGGFSVERAKQIIGEQESPEKVKEILENILLMKPTNFNEQKKAFEELLKHLKNEISLIVVDGMTILYRIEFASAREEDRKDEKEMKEMKKINAELVRQIKMLAEIAIKKNIPVIITNQVYKWDDEKRMVGGDILRYWSKCHIELANESGRKTAILRKHRSLPEKKLDFEIVNSGIRRRGWI